ncbi:hypothetical protein [Phytopseudomonas dryadis]|uniref:hypothetical protein n=1 Tax=Pseudomonadaceae TaxID=135621 RepID=UPI0013F169D1|nr:MULTISPECIES: hypothetical protein [Pseudomonas]
MQQLEVMIGLIGLGFLLLVTGYSRREFDYGVLMIAAGIGVMFATIGYKLYLVLG